MEDRRRDLDWPQVMTLRQPDTPAVPHPCLVSIPSFRMVLWETRA